MAALTMQGREKLRAKLDEIFGKYDRFSIRQGSPAHTELRDWLKRHTEIEDYDARASQIMGEEAQRRRPPMDSQLGLFEQDPESLLVGRHEGDQVKLKHATDRDWDIYQQVLTDQFNHQATAFRSATEFIKKMRAEYEKHPKCKTWTDLKKAVEQETEPVTV